MFEKSKSAITFKEFQDTLNVINNFENEWGHFCDPDNNNNINNILQNNYYLYKKEPAKIIKDKEDKYNKKQDTTKDKEDKYNKKQDTTKDTTKDKEDKYNKNQDTKDKEAKKISIIKTIFNYTIIISISISVYIIYKLSETGGG